MKGIKEPALILVVIFIMLGFVYGSLKNSEFGSENMSKSGSSATGQNAVGKNGSGDGFGYAPNKIVANEIKSAEKDIQDLQKDIAKKIEEGKRSPYYGKINMSNISGRNNPDPSREYVRLSTDLDAGEKIKITGWYMQSEVTGYFAIIGGASILPFPFSKTESDVVLEKGDRVILTKGFSPIGISFRTNKCTGYFEENRTFYPSLSRQCPKPIDENLPTFSNVYDRNDECLDLIERIPRCATRGNEYLRDLPDTVPLSCKTYIKEQINYNSCVAKHFGDTDFPGNEYRIYLNRFGPLWRKEREKINLHDENGLIVDSIDY